MDAAPSATAGLPGNHRGSDGLTGVSRRSGNETRNLRTGSVHGVTLGSGASTASMLGEILDRGTDGPTGNGRRSGSEARSLRTASVHGMTLGSDASTASMLGEILARGTDGPTGNGRRSGSETRSLRTASMHGATLGGGTSTTQGNPRGSEAPSRKGTLARGSVLKEPRFPSSNVFFEQRTDPSSFR